MASYMYTYSYTIIYYKVIISAVNYPFQQIKASDIWRESEHEDLQHQLLGYHVKITMKGNVFDPPAIKFEGSTDDSQLDINLKIDYGMNEFIQNIIIPCAHKHTLLVIMHMGDTQLKSC